MSLFCASCGLEIKADGQFCTQCGATPSTPGSAPGVAEILSHDISPFSTASSFLAVAERASQLTVVGTGLSDFRHLVDQDPVRRHIKSGVVGGALRLSVYTLDPSFDEYLSLRRSELQGTTVDPTQRAVEAYDLFAELKVRWLRETERRGHGVRDNLRVGVYRSMPRAALLQADREIFVRPYMASTRGGEAPFTLRLSADATRSVSALSRNAFEMYGDDLERIIAGADERLLLTVDDDGHTFYEHRAIVHRLPYLHHTVHLVGVDEDGLVWLQRRRATAARNPSRWTSMVSGHVEHQDEGDFLKAVSREAAEELPEGLSSLSNVRLLSTIPELVSRGVRAAEYDVPARNHTCRSIAHVFLANVKGLEQGHSAEVAEFRGFSSLEIRHALSDPEGTFALADNFPPVGQLVLREMG